KDNSQKLIIGGVSGGIFTSDDGGLNWTDHPQNTEFLSLSISAIAQAPNGNIYVGTGEHFGNSDYGFGKVGSSILPGTGIYKSTDEGNSFQLLEATIPTISGLYNYDWNSIQDIEVNPNNSNLVYAATNRGLQISQDGGETWSKANGIPSISIAYDIALASDGKVHVLAESRYYRATDGLNFTGEFSGNNTPEQFEFSSRNKALAISPSDNNYLYIVTIKDNGCLKKVWQSKNGGETWEVIGEGSNSFQPLRNNVACQGWYDLCLAVDPNNRERIFLGGVTLWSWSPENSWNQLDSEIAPYYLHPDKHTIVFDPQNPDIMYIGSDGGIARSLNAQDTAPTFEAINKNYFVTQFYGIAANIEGNAIGGTQDNGTIFLDSEGNSMFENQPYITGGDGGFCEFSRFKPLAAFVSSPNGGIKRSASSQPPFSSFFDYNTDCTPGPNTGSCNPDGHLDGNPLYITPFLLWEDIVANLIDPSVQKSMFITGSCNGKIWMTEGALDFTAIPSWREIGNFAGNRCVSAISISDDGKTVYAGTLDGRVMRITNLDRDEPTTKEFRISNNSSQYVSSIAINFNTAHIIVSLGNYGQAQNIVESNDATSINPTFSSIQHNLPLMPVYSVAIDHFNTIIAGTELGIWLYDISTQTWTEENGKTGRVPVHSLRFQTVANPGCEVLYAGTHGRGVYRSTDFLLPGCGDIFPEDTVGIEPLNQISQIQLYPNPMLEKSTLEITLLETTDLKLQIFDLQGRMVRQQNLGELAARNHKIEIERGDLIAGNYVVILYAGKKLVSKKLIVK
ncbi:MAG: T9SS type A sorting domain-containing protein, partial [Chitinophagales bacterium]